MEREYTLNKFARQALKFAYMGTKLKINFPNVDIGQLNDIEAYRYAVALKLKRACYNETPKTTVW